MARHTRRAVLGGLAAVGLAGCTGRLGGDGERTAETSERTLSTVPETLSVTNEVGAVSVTGEDRSDVGIELTRRGPPGRIEKLAFGVQRDGSSVSLVGETTNEGLIQNDAGLSLEITVRVPTSVAVERVETTVGDVRLTGVGGDPTVESTVSEVTVRSVSGFVSAQTTAGDVTIRDVGGLDRVEATTGDLALDVPSLRSDSSITTTTGDVDLAVAPELDAAVSVSAETGSVTVSELPLTVTEQTTGAEVNGTLGGGDDRLSVETTVGTVTLRRLPA